MRLWTISPQYLDSKGLVALWREGLLGKKVLAGNTNGYRNHPQLNRFKSHPDSEAAIDQYLSYVISEALNRGYKFNSNKLQNLSTNVKIPVTLGQINYELEHLKEKLMTRDPIRLEMISKIETPEVSPIFTIVEGNVEDWEIVT